MWPNPQETAHLVTYTEEILNWKLHFLCSVIWFGYGIRDLLIWLVQMIFAATVEFIWSRESEFSYENLPNKAVTQLTFTCSKSTIETEEGVKYVQS